MSEPLKIALVAGPLSVTAPNVAALDLGKALVTRGHEVSLVAGDGPLRDRFLANGVTAESVGLTGSFLTDLPRVPRLKRLVRSRPPDIVHVVDPRLARHGALLSRLSGRPWIVSVDDPCALPQMRPGSRLKAVLVSGRAPRDELVAKRGAPAEAVRAVPPGVDVERYPDPPGLFEEETPVVCALQRFDDGSGLSDLARAVRILLDEDVTLHLLVAGSGPGETRLRRLVRELELERHVTVTALPTSFEGIVLSADVVVMPGVDAWSGTEILQAMAAARPVVASGVGVNFTVIEEAETGLLAPRRSPAALADRIRSLLEDPGRAEEMGRAGRKRAEREFGIDKTADSVEDVYREVLAEGDDG